MMLMMFWGAKLEYIHSLLACQGGAFILSILGTELIKIDAPHT